MRAQNWTDVMTLLAVMVVSNKMNKEAELTMFEHAAIDLRNMFAPNIQMTNSFANDWMSANRSSIESQASSVHFNGAVKRLHKSLDGLIHKHDILTIIMKWTMADKPRSERGELRFISSQTESENGQYSRLAQALAG